jgi:hypothetical protein
MSFRYIGLSPAPFAPLFALDDAELAERSMRRMIADAKPGFPCRVSLEDAEPGERLILLPFAHHVAHAPFRASGPIFVREAAREKFDRTGAAPEQLRGRLLSVRGYDADGMMVDAEVTDGRELEPVLARLFTIPSIGYVHLHFARQGCYAARVERAE